MYCCFNLIVCVHRVHFLGVIRETYLFEHSAPWRLESFMIPLPCFTEFLYCNFTQFQLLRVFTLCSLPRSGFVPIFRIFTSYLYPVQAVRILMLWFSYPKTKIQSLKVHWTTPQFNELGHKKEISKKNKQLILKFPIPSIVYPLFHYYD